MARAWLVNFTTVVRSYALTSVVLVHRCIKLGYTTVIRSRRGVVEGLHIEMKV